MAHIEEDQPARQLGVRRLKRFVTIAWALLALASLLPASAQAQAGDYPNRFIKMIVLFGPGGASDVAARFCGSKIEPALGQQMVVENRTGAGGTVGAMAVKNAPADGYTILVATNTPMSINPITEKDLPYDPTRDFKPISGMIKVQNVLLVAADSPIKSLSDMVSMAKVRSKPMTVGTFSVGHQMTTEWLAGVAGFKFTNVPYKSGGDILNNLIGGEIDVGSVDLPSAAALIKAGKVRALATTGEKRHPLYADVPTVSETYPEYVTYSWSSLYVRRETPEIATRKLIDAVQAALSTPEAAEFATRASGELMPLDPVQMEAMQIAELKRFSAIARAAGIQPK